MFEALQIAATGMQAQQAHVDAIANNLANLDTPGYKKSRVAFFDLVVRAAAPAVADELATPTASARGAGVGIASVSKLFDAGDLRRTDNPLDIAILGDGFLEVTLADGSRAYSRGGSFKVGADGELTTQAGQPLGPSLLVPADTQSLTITPDGRVLAASAARPAPLELGQLQMVRFMSPGGLSAMGDGLYRASAASGEPISGRPGEDAMGTLRQGHLEGSNVKMVDEMVNLMVAQRAYEASVKVVQTSDEMLGMVNGLRK